MIFQSKKVQKLTAENKKLKAALYKAGSYCRRYPLMKIPEDETLREIFLMGGEDPMGLKYVEYFLSEK